MWCDNFIKLICTKREEKLEIAFPECFVVQAASEVRGLRVETLFSSCSLRFSQQKPLKFDRVVAKLSPGNKWNFPRCPFYRWNSTTAVSKLFSSEGINVHISTLCCEKQPLLVFVVVLPHITYVSLVGNCVR